MTTALDGRTGRQREALRVVFLSVHQGPHALLLERWGISRSSCCEFTPAECFNPPLELFGPGWSISTLRANFVRFASNVVLMRTQFTTKRTKIRW